MLLSLSHESAHVLHLHVACATLSGCLDGEVSDFAISSMVCLFILFFA